jgi:hypothetical protein
LAWLIGEHGLVHAHLISWLRATTAARGLWAAVEHDGDLVDLLGA